MRYAQKSRFTRLLSTTLSFSDSALVRSNAEQIKGLGEMREFTSMLVQPKTEWESAELVGVPQFGDDTDTQPQDNSLLSTPLRSTLLLGSLNGTPTSCCHMSNSSVEGSAHHLQRSDSANLCKSTMSCGSHKKDMIQLPREPSDEPKYCVEDEMPDHFPSSLHSISFCASVKIEAETLDDKVTDGLMHGGSCNIKRQEVSLEFNKETQDHIPFSERIRMLTMSQNNETNYVFHEENVGSGGALLGGGQLSDAIRLCKRKKIATASTETPLDEDAPGLFEVLTKKRISIDDVRLSDAQMDFDDLTNDALPEESFSDIENDITKDTSLQPTTLSTLLLRSVNETPMSYCHVSNSSIEGSAHHSQRLHSTNLLKPNMSCVDQKKDIIQLPSETSDVPKICIKDETLDHAPSICFSASVKNEAEALDDKVTYGHVHGGSGTTEREEVSFGSEEVKLDHIPFNERIRMLRMSQTNKINYVFHSESVGSDDALLRGGQPSAAIRLRKRKKTATVSAQTALEEDAPGLLKVLIEKGISVDDIRLYDSQMDSDDLTDDGLPEESFSELENVITKIFARNTSLLKLAPIRFTKGSRTTYCLECLMALVEQAKYLHACKLPVEWGWCRDIQSFIFVFEMHNRIVLERPEYGCATYFFETMASLPISWQIKRLVIAMKLTSCRLNILENKILQVGKELSEGEAQVLMNCGWTPNTGLGTMLNYHDRVYHDRKTEEKYRSEWRSKIGTLLAAGYNAGSIVSKTYLGEHASECVDAKDPSIKLEV